MDSTYPELIQNYSDEKYLKSRAILASRIETDDEINDYILSLIPSKAFVIRLTPLSTIIHATKKT